MSVALIVLAAGKGTRMQSDMPKVLHPIAGAPMLWHALRAGRALEPERCVVVTGHGSEAVAASAQDFDPDAVCVVQTEQLGTAHAVAEARPALEGFSGDAIVLYGDTPFISEETLQAMSEARSKHDVVVLGFEAKDPARYGRLVTEGDALLRIVEFKEASEDIRAITLCNSGVVAADATVLFDLISEVGNENAAGEYYLTDIVEIARTKGLSATVVRCPESETMGVNSRVDLAAAEAAFQARARTEAMETGVTLQAPETVTFGWDTVIGRDSHLEPNVFFGPGVTVESGAKIRAFCHLEDCHISRGASVGPFARLRGGTELSENVKIGNFVELKAAMLDEGVKAGHLTYVGDATVGKNTNFGAGTVTCNYDGVLKHKTTIGTDVFVGSGSMLVAPVTLGDRSMTASGSVITQNVEPEALALARAHQVTKPGYATKLMELLRMKKAQKAKGQ